MNESDEVIEARADALVADHEKLLENLVRHRRRHKLSQDEVASRMGVTQPTVAAFERYDSNPTLATIRRYALAVGALIVTKVIDDCVPHRSTGSNWSTVSSISTAGSSVGMIASPVMGVIAAHLSSSGNRQEQLVTP